MDRKLTPYIPRGRPDAKIIRSPWKNLQQQRSLNIPKTPTHSASQRIFPTQLFSSISKPNRGGSDGDQISASTSISTGPLKSSYAKSIGPSIVEGNPSSSSVVVTTTKLVVDNVGMVVVKSPKGVRMNRTAAMRQEISHRLLNGWGKSKPTDGRGESSVHKSIGGPSSLVRSKSKSEGMKSSMMKK